MFKNISDTSFGIMVFIIPMLGLPVIDACAKILFQLGYDIYQVASVRFLIQGLFILALLIYSNKAISNIYRNNIKPKIIISIGTMGLTIGFYSAMTYTSISVALSILFTAPLITIILSSKILNERILPVHIIACVLGFIGTIVIIRPASDEFNTGALLVLISAVSWSVIMLTHRVYGKQLDARETQCFSGFFGFIIYSAIFIFSNPTADILPTWSLFWYIIIFIGVLSAIFYLLVQYAHSYTSASTLAPIQYLEMLSGLILDLVLFSIVPDTMTWIGISLIIISGLFVIQINKQHTIK